MNLSFKKNIKENTNTGFTNQVSKQGNRLFDKNGNLNVIKRGVKFGDKISLYQLLLTASWWKFITFVLVFYFFINTIFAFLYLLIGIENLGGIEISTDFTDMFLEAYFFSAQTFTTVGYGSVHPQSVSANFLASVESLLGLFSLAIGTGLLYGRFTQPVINLIFSENALISPYNSGKALMFRLANTQNSVLTDVEVKTTIAMTLDENGTEYRRFYTSRLETSKVSSLALSWTVVHPIDQESPIYNMTQSDLEKTSFEFVINISCFENTSSQFVSKRFSYNFEDIIWGAKFEIIFNKSSDSNATEIHLDRLNEFKIVSLPI